MTQDYTFYLSGCSEEGERPLAYWRFYLAYGSYQRYFYDAFERDLQTGELRLRKDYMPLVRWSRLRRLAKQVDRGRELAQSGPRYLDDDEGQTGGPGVREPRRPISPLLSGAGARTFAAAVYEYDRPTI